MSKPADEQAASRKAGNRSSNAASTATCPFTTMAVQTGPAWASTASLSAA